MNKFALLFLSLVAAGSGLLTAAVRAEEPAPSAMPKAASEGHEMMGGDMKGMKSDMQGMMKMMARMNDMMERCDRMMSRTDGRDGNEKK